MNSNATAAPADEQKGIRQRGLITLGGALLGAGMVFVNEILVARYLGVALYGLYALALVIARIAETVSLFGLRSGLMHFLPVYREKQAADAVGMVVAALVLPLALGLGCLALIWFLAPWIAAVLLDEPAATPYLRLFALPIPLMCLTEMLGVITRGYGRAEYYVVIRNLTPPAIYLLLLLGLIVTEGAPTQVAYAFTLAQLVATAVGSIIVVRVMQRYNTWQRPTAQFSRLYVYAFPIMINTLLYTLMAASDVLMLGNMRGAADAGIYRACIQFRPAFDMAVLAFNAAAIHLYPIYHREKRQGELNDSFATVLRMTGAATVGLFVLVFISRSDILGLLGPEFPAGAPAMFYLLIGFLFQGCLGSAGILLVVTGFQRFETHAAFIGVVLNIGLNIVLIPRFGTLGAGIATAVAMLVLNLLRVYHVRKRLDLHTLRGDLLRSATIAAVVLAVMLGLMPVMGLSDGGGFVPLVIRSSLALLLLVLGFRFFGPRKTSQTVNAEATPGERQ